MPSLYTCPVSTYHPFAGLAFDQMSESLEGATATANVQEHAKVMSKLNTSAGDGSHGGADGLTVVGDSDEYIGLKDGAHFMLHGGAVDGGCENRYDLEDNVPLFSFAPVDFQSAAMVSMFSQYNALLDPRCTHHIIRDRHLFCAYAEKSISVDTANCGSLEVLGIGDVEFRCPFHGRHVVFTLRGCLYAPDAPINLLSVGTLVERGMSCLFSSGGLTKVFYPRGHAKFPGFTFPAVVTNRLSFLKLVFLPPKVSVFPKYMPFDQASSSSLLFADLTFNHNLLPTPRQHADVVSNTCTVVASLSASDAVEVAGPGACKQADVALTSSATVALLAHAGVMIVEDQAAKSSLSLPFSCFTFVQAPLWPAMQG